MHDTCPRCGYRSKPYTMATDPDAPSFVDLWQGDWIQDDDNNAMRWIARIGSLVLSIGFLVGLLLAFNTLN